MKTQLIRSFRDKLGKGYVLGPFSKTSDPAFVEVMGHAGMDFVILDLEHGPNSVQTLQNLIRAAELSELLPIVRVKEDRMSVIGEVLDIGAGGVQVPQVTTASQAREIVERAKFAPVGMRGVCRFVRAADYSSMDRFAYFQEANEALVVLQLEGLEAIGNVEEILGVSGVDIIFIGPYDLSQSLGVAGQIDHPDVVARMKQITALCQAKGVSVGTFTDTIEGAQRWIAAGIAYVSYSVDVGLFTDQCRHVVSKLRQQSG